MSTTPSAIVDLIPSAYDGDIVKERRDFASQAWNGVQARELIAFIDSLLSRGRVYVDDYVSDITWATPRGELSILTIRGDVVCFQAAFNREHPCRWLSLFAALLAGMFELQAVTEGGIVREPDPLMFAAAIRQHVSMPKTQSTTLH